MVEQGHGGGGHHGVPRGVRPRRPPPLQLDRLARVAEDGGVPPRPLDLRLPHRHLQLLHRGLHTLCQPGQRGWDVEHQDRLPPGHRPRLPPRLDPRQERLRRLEKWWNDDGQIYAATVLCRVVPPFLERMSNLPRGGLKRIHFMLCPHFSFGENIEVLHEERYS